jgi:hypothetical protein
MKFNKYQVYSGRSQILVLDFACILFFIKSDPAIGASNPFACITFVVELGLDNRDPTDEALIFSISS